MLQSMESHGDNGVTELIVKSTGREPPGLDLACLLEAASLPASWKRLPVL